MTIHAELPRHRCPASLNNALATPGTDTRRAIADAISQLDRLENTVEDLLRLARDPPGPHVTFDVAGLVRDAQETWHSRLADRGRPLRVAVDEDLPREGCRRRPLVR